MKSLKNGISDKALFGVSSKPELQFLELNLMMLKPNNDKDKILKKMESLEKLLFLKNWER